VSPIYTRPIREQAEHDRVIRQLQVRYKRKHEVAINPGAERNQAVMVGDLECFPDLVLYSTDRSRKLEGTVEVETGESVHLLEARSEWGVFTKLKVPFHLYVPPQSIESAKRMCEEQQFPVAEIWTYHMALDQVRFTQVYRSPNAPKPGPSPAPRAGAKAKPAVKAKAVARPEPKAAKPVVKSSPVKAAPVKTMVKAVVKAVAKVVATAKAASNPPAKTATKPAKAVVKLVAKAAVKPAAKAKSVKPVAKPVAIKKRR
jgi:hypothetical protein